MRKILYIAMSFLAVSVVVALNIFGYVYYKDRISTEEKKNEDLISEFNATLSKYGSKISSIELENAGLVSALEEEKKLRLSAQKEVRDLKSKFMCKEKISWEVDYSNSATVSESLKRWVEEDYSVVNSSYETVWDNSKTSYHEINSQEFLFPYIVFFDENDMGYKRGIFSIGLQCWID